MRFPLLAAVLGLTLFGPAGAAAVQSTITEAEGYACLGDDRSTKETEQAAIGDAKRNAVEFAATLIRSRTEVEDFKLVEDLIWAYSQGTVRLIEVLERAWYQDPRAGECLRVKLRAEVIPDEATLDQADGVGAEVDNPTLPLQAKIWTDRDRYRAGSTVKIYLRANKPFFARVVHRDARGSLTQLLPNPYRTDHYFQGGVSYQIPSGEDRFELAVTPPFGAELITLYASTRPLGDIEMEEAGAVYAITTPARDLGRVLRGLRIRPGASRPEIEEAAAEFVEASVEIVAVQ